MNKPYVVASPNGSRILFIDRSDVIASMLCFEFFADLKFPINMIFCSRGDMIGLSVEWAANELLDKVLQYLLDNSADDLYLN